MGSESALRTVDTDTLARCASWGNEQASAELVRRVGELKTPREVEIELSEACEKARDLGYDEGWREGRDEGRNEAYDELDGMITAARKAK